MHKDLKQIQEAAQGLFFISESDYPFEVVELKQNDKIEQQLLELASKPPGSTIEKITLPYFFRNMVSLDSNADNEQGTIANNFKHLQSTLTEKLENIEVWRIGTIQIDAFIIGKLSDGSLGGLRTKLVET